MKHDFSLESVGMVWSLGKGGWIQKKRGSTYWSRWKTNERFFELMEEHRILYGE